MKQHEEKNELHSLLMKKGYTLAVAESCTGGMIGAVITSVAGSSAYFRGGVIAYNNQIKTGILGVPKEVLEEKGAVSHETVEAMAEGVCRLLGADCSVSVSGIAGPGGGTEEKPVGLVYIGVCTPRTTKTFECRCNGSRQSIRQLATGLAISNLIKQLREDQT